MPEVEAVVRPAKGLLTSDKLGHAVSDVASSSVFISDRAVAIRGEVDHDGGGW